MKIFNCSEWDLKVIINISAATNRTKWLIRSSTLIQLSRLFKVTVAVFDNSSNISDKKQSTMNFIKARFKFISCRFGGVRTIQKDYMDQKPKNKNIFSGPSSNKNSRVSESRDPIFLKKFHQKSFRQIELLFDVFGF